MTFILQQACLDNTKKFEHESVCVSRVSNLCTRCCSTNTRHLLFAQEGGKIRKFHPLTAGNTSPRCIKPFPACCCREIASAVENFVQFWHLRRLKRIYVIFFVESLKHELRITESVATRWTRTNRQVFNFRNFHGCAVLTSRFVCCSCFAL